MATKAVVKQLAFALVALPGYCLAGDSASSVAWKNLCVPQELVTWVQSAGPTAVPKNSISDAAQHLEPNLDTSSVPLLGLYLPGKMLADKVPGYIAEVKRDLGGGDSVRQHLGASVTIKLAQDAVKPHQEAFIENYKAIWTLGRVWKGFTWQGAKIEKLPGTSLYKVTPQTSIKYGDYFALLTIDPSKHSKTDPDFNNFNSWYVGTCASKNSVGFECQRALLGKDYYVEYSVTGPNINKVPELDIFITNELHEWQKNCQGEKDN